MRSLKSPCSNNYRVEKMDVSKCLDKLRVLRLLGGVRACTRQSDVFSRIGL